MEKNICKIYKKYPKKVHRDFKIKQGWWSSFAEISSDL